MGEYHCEMLVKLIIIQYNYRNIYLPSDEVANGCFQAVLERKGCAFENMLAVHRHD